MTKETATLPRMATNEKPQVDVPSGQDPSGQLEVEDLEVGDGDEAAPGTVEVHYVGVAWCDRQAVRRLVGPRRHLQFGLGQGQVIQGWDQGVAGMKVGGRRRLTIPPGWATAAAAPAAPSVPTRRSSSSWTSSASARRDC